MFVVATFCTVCPLKFCRHAVRLRLSSVSTLSLSPECYYTKTIGVVALYVMMARGGVTGKFHSSGRFAAEEEAYRIHRRGCVDSRAWDSDSRPADTFLNYVRTIKIA